MTATDLLAMPDDGIDRWIVVGEVEVIGPAIRGKRHSRTTALTSFALSEWLESQQAPRGALHTGNVGVTLRTAPELSVGIDVVYLNAEQAERNDAVDDDETTLLIAPITLAVEVLSPSDTIENIHRKLDWFEECGVPLVWVLNPYQRTVAVYRPNVPPETFNELQDLDGGAELPGFRVPVASLFAR